MARTKSNKPFPHYTRICIKCKKYFKTKARQGKVCKNCTRSGNSKALT